MRRKEKTRGQLTLPCVSSGEGREEENGATEMSRGRDKFCCRFLPEDKAAVSGSPNQFRPLFTQPDGKKIFPRTIGDIHQGALNDLKEGQNQTFFEGLRT